jgi:hypothetical protein
VPVAYDCSRKLFGPVGYFDISVLWAAGSGLVEMEQFLKQRLWSNLLHSEDSFNFKFLT